MLEAGPLRAGATPPPRPAARVVTQRRRLRSAARIRHAQGGRRDVADVHRPPVGHRSRRDLRVARVARPGDDHRVGQDRPPAACRGNGSAGPGRRRRRVTTAAIRGRGGRPRGLRGPRRSRPAPRGGAGRRGLVCGAHRPFSTAGVAAYERPIPGGRPIRERRRASGGWCERRADQRPAGLTGLVGEARSFSGALLRTAPRVRLARPAGR